MYNVLIVDDEQGILDGFQKLINWNEFGIAKVITALSAENAIELMKNNHIDILISDVCMDKMNGIELIAYCIKHYPHIKHMIQSGYDDFHYVKEAMHLGIENYLLKPVNEEELISSLILIGDKIELEKKEITEKKINADLVLENVLLRWVSNNIAPQELISKSKTLDLELNNECYCVALIKDANFKREEYEKNYEYQLQQRQLHSFILNTAQLKVGINAYCFVNMKSQIVLILHFESDQFSNIKDKIKELLQQVHLLKQVNLFAVLGDCVTTFENVPKSYNDAQYLLNIQTIDSINTLSEWSVRDKKRNDLEKNIPIHFEKITKSIKSLDKIEMDHLLQEIKYEIVKSEMIGSCWENIVLQQIAISIIDSIDLQEHIALYEQFEHLIIKIQNDHDFDFGDCMISLQKLADACIDALNYQQSSYAPVVTEVISLINTDYAQDLNLSAIATKYKMNVVYLGQLFKNDVGDYFSGYLNNYRIEKAKQFLEESDLSVQEIGSKVGYLNKAHFFSVFKKIMGSTPTEYRRKKALENMASL